MGCGCESTTKLLAANLHQVQHEAILEFSEFGRQVTWVSTMVVRVGGAALLAVLVTGLNESPSISNRRHGSNEISSSVSGGGKRHQGAAEQISRALRLSFNRGTLHTQDDLLRVAQHLATPSRGLLFSTVSMDKPMHQLLLLRQWVGNLRGRTANVLLIGANLLSAY